MKILQKRNMMEDSNTKYYMMKVENKMNNRLAKAIKLAGAATIAASAYVAVSPIQADAAVSAESLVKKAEASKLQLQRAVSVDYRADAKTEPWTEFNQAKKDYTAAKATVNKLSGKQKQILGARLDDVNLWIVRGGHYIDAITSGKKLAQGQANLNALLAKGKMEEATTAYHQLSYEIKKQAAMLYRVYGQSTRQAILNTYKIPAEAAKQKALYPVSVHMELNRLIDALERGDADKAIKYMTNIEAWLDEVEEGPAFDTLVDRYMDIIYSLFLDIEIVVYEDAHFTAGDHSVSAFDVFSFYDEDGNELDKEDMNTYFIVRDDKGCFNEEGKLNEAYAQTGLPAGKVIISLYDINMEEKMVDVEIDIKAPAAN